MNFHYRLLTILALYMLSVFAGYHLIDDPKQNTSVVAILVLALMPIIIVMFCDALFHLVYSKYIYTVKTTTYTGEPIYLTWYLYHERGIQPSKELIRKRAISKFSKYRFNLEAHMEIIYVLKGKV